MLKIFLVTSLFIFSLSANIAVVVDKVGSITLTRAGESLPLQLKAQLQVHDMIKTGAGAKVKIFFRDNTAVSLGQNTSFSIDSYLFDGSKQSNAQFGIVKGFFKTVSGRIGKIAPNRFKLKTKNATIGIRGTVFAGTVGQKEDRVICTDGKIFVKSPFGTVDIGSGNGGVFYAAQNPQVKHYGEKEKLLIIKKAGWKGSKSLKELIEYIKKNFQEPLRGQLLATIQNILNKDSDARRKYLGLQKKLPLKKVVNADNISFVDDIHINGREMDSLDERSIEFYTDDLIDGKVVVDGMLESEDDSVKVEDLFVEISIDGGSTWKRAQGHNEWKWSFTPEIGEEYEFSLQVVKETTVHKKENFTPVVIAGASDTDLFTSKEPSSKVYKKQFSPKVITTQPIVLRFKAFTPKVIRTQPMVLKFETFTPRVITIQPIVLKFKTFTPKIITTSPIVLKFKNGSLSSTVIHKSTLGYKKYNKSMEYKLNKGKDYKDGALNGVKDNVHTDMLPGTQRGALPGGLGDKIPTHNGKTDSEITGVDLGGDVGNFDGVGASGSGVHGEIGDGKRSFQGHGYGIGTPGTGDVGVSNHGWNSMNSRAKYNQMTGNGDINNPIGARDTLAKEKSMGFESSKYDEGTMTGSPVSASPYLKDGEKLSHNSDDGDDQAQDEQTEEERAKEEQAYHDQEQKDEEQAAKDQEEQEKQEKENEKAQEEQEKKNEQAKKDEEGSLEGGGASPDPIDNENTPVHMTNRQKAASSKVMSHAKNPVSYVGGKNGGRGDGRSPRDDNGGGGMVLIGGGQDAPGDGNPEDRNLHGGYVQGGKVKTTLKEKLGGNIHVDSK